MQSVIQAFRVLQEVAETQPIGVSDLSRRLEIPKSTAHRVLKTLEKVGWVLQRRATEGSLWVLSAAPVILAQKVAQDSNLRGVARPIMERLRDECSEAVHLAVPQSGEIVVIDQVEANQSIRIHWPVGQHSAVHASANGKAIVAFSRGEQLKSLYPQNFEKFTQATISSSEEFEKELNLVRNRGYATVHGELRDDICSFAAPIFDVKNHPIASLSAFMPTYRLPADQERIGALVKAAADEIAKSMRTGSI